VVPVLFVTGPVGVGKTTVLREADALLIEAGASHASVELEELARCWTVDAPKARTPLVLANLGALWRNYAAAGASRLLLSGLVERRADLDPLAEVVRGAVTLVRLDAPLHVLEARVREREPGPPEAELDGARWWAEHLSRAQLEDHLVETEGRPAREIAREVLVLAGWL
jgi:hypothetical protein